MYFRQTFINAEQIYLYILPDMTAVDAKFVFDKQS